MKSGRNSTPSYLVPIFTSPYIYYRNNGFTNFSELYDKGDREQEADSSNVTDLKERNFDQSCNDDGDNDEDEIEHEFDLESDSVIDCCDFHLQPTFAEVKEAYQYV